MRREDSLKIVKLHQEIEHLKLIIKSKDEEILRLKREEQPQPQQLLKRLLPGVKLENENTKDLTFSFNKYSKYPSLTVSPIKRNQLIKIQNLLNQMIETRRVILIHDLLNQCMTIFI